MLLISEFVMHLPPFSRTKLSVMLSTLYVSVEFIWQVGFLDEKWKQVI